jgi:hypothetical protein
MTEEYLICHPSKKLVTAFFGVLGSEVFGGVYLHEQDKYEEEEQDSGLHSELGDTK